jgi:hypothetical protein
MVMLLVSLLLLAFLLFARISALANILSASGMTAVAEISAAKGFLLLQDSNPIAGLPANAGVPCCC